MKAYPTVSSFTHIVRTSFKLTIFILLITATGSFGYAQELVSAESGRECYSPLQPAMNAVAVKSKGAHIKTISGSDLKADPLPVKLGAFNAARLDDAKVNLEWITREETNVSHFVLERSFDGKEFDEAALVFAYGESKEPKTYKFKDAPRKKNFSVVYYRLRIVDMDGKTERSSVRTIGKTD